MDSNDQESRPTIDSPLAAMMRRELLRLAAAEDELAATEGAEVPYWVPCPDSVLGHRAAARTLRARADRLLRNSLSLGAAS